MKYCELKENKICDDCGQCQVCDLDKNKICDNCCECIGLDSEYNIVEIDSIEDGVDYGFSQDEERVFTQWMEKKRENK